MESTLSAFAVIKLKFVHNCIEPGKVKVQVVNVTFFSENPACRQRSKVDMLGIGVSLPKINGFQNCNALRCHNKKGLCC